jgi:outer membrane protein assembly factor BamB
VRPAVLSVSPGVGASSVPLRSAIRIEFSEALNPTSVSLATLSLEAAGVPVPGTVTYSGTTATFRPADPLRGTTDYTVNLTRGVEDPSGNPLATAKSWSFTTGAASPVAPLRQAVGYQVDAGHTGAIAFGMPLALPGSPTWSVRLPGEASYPLIAGGRVFVTTSGLDGGYGTQLHALHAASGAVAWGPIAIPGLYFNSGIAYDQGKVFVLNFDGLLRSFDAATGAEGWSTKLPLQYAFTSPPTAVDGVVYASGAGSGGSVYAIDASNGQLIWQSAIWTDGSSPAVHGDGVFVAYSCQVVKLDAYTGAPSWRHQGDCTGGGGGRALVVANGSVHARDVNGTSGVLLDPATGTPTGTFAGGWPSPMPAVTAQTEFHLVAGTLRAIDVATREVRWSFAGDGRLASAPIVIDETVIIGSGSGMVYAIDRATGTPSWSASAGAGISEFARNGPTGLAAGEGYLVVPAGDVLTGWKLRP